MDKTSLGFPFNINDSGRVDSLTGDENIRAKIIQLLFTSPGERVNMPEFGCGLMNLVFEPNNTVLAATTEFTVKKALERWLWEDIIVQDLDVTSEGEKLMITLVYMRKDTMERKAMRISY